MVPYIEDKRLELDKKKKNSFGCVWGAGFLLPVQTTLFVCWSPSTFSSTMLILHGLSS